MSALIRWDRLPLAASLPAARDWIERQGASDLSPATVGAYSRAVERYLTRCRELCLDPASATTGDLAGYFRELDAAGLGAAAIRQRYAAIRLFYAWVVERRERSDNPLGSRLPGSGPRADAGRPASAPSLPSEEEWSSVLRCASVEPLRTRLMIAVAYLGALRREDICRIRASRSDLPRRTLWVRSSSGLRPIPVSTAVAAGVEEYLSPGAAPAPLFTSESRRNPHQPITVWTWAKLTRQIAGRSGVAGFTPATLRHLRLADLAGEGMSAAEIARFAGYRSPRLAHRYVEVARERAAGGREGLRETQIDLLVRGGRP